MTVLARSAAIADQLSDALIVTTVLSASAIVAIALTAGGVPDSRREPTTQSLLGTVFLVVAGALAGVSVATDNRDRLHRASRALLAWAVTLMVVITVLIVGLRYGAGVGTIGLQEGVIYLHGGMFLLGIPYALRHDAHVRVDLVYARLSVRRRAAINLFGHVAFLIPVAVVLISLSMTYVAGSWRVVEGSAEVGGVPAVFVLKTLIPIAGLVLLVQGIAECCKALSVLTAGDADERAIP